MIEQTLGEVATIIDCEHKTAPNAEPGEAYGYSVGTRSLKAGRIDYSSCKRVDRQTLTQWTKRGRPLAGDLILAREAPVGQVGYVDGQLPVCLGQRTVLVRANKAAVDARFLHFLLLSPPLQQWMASTSAGSTVPHLNVADIRNLPLGQLPPLEEQRRIAGVLGALDDLAERDERLMNAARGLITSLFRRCIQNADQLKPIGELIDFRFGAPFRGTEFSDAGDGRPLLRIRDLKTFRPDTWTTERRSDETLVVPGDVVFGMDAEFRPTWWLGGEAVLNQRVGLAVPLIGGRAFAREILEGPLREIESYKTGTTVIHLNKRDLQTIQVRVPSIDSIRDFSERVEPLLNLVIGLSSEATQLKRTRDELLPLLLSGRVLVGEVAA